MFSLRTKQAMLPIESSLLSSMPLSIDAFSALVTEKLTKETLSSMVHTCVGKTCAKKLCPGCCLVIPQAMKAAVDLHTTYSHALRRVTNTHRRMVIFCLQNIFAKSVSQAK